MQRLLKSLLFSTAVTGAAAAALLVLDARSGNSAPAPASDFDEGPFVDADEFSEEEAEAMMRELMGQLGDLPS